MSIQDVDTWPKDNIESIRISVAPDDRLDSFALHNMCGVACGATNVCRGGERAVNVNYYAGFDGLQAFTEVPLIRV